jgi:hypothetical protein
VPEADLVLEGGGVKGLGTAGAVMALPEAGYTVPRVAGTSVGAVAACFVAAGVDAAGFREFLGRLDLRRIPDRRIPLPLVSESFSLLTHRGAYAGDWLHGWLVRELDRLGVRTFADLPEGLGDLVPFYGAPVLPAVRLLEQVVATALVCNDQTHLDRPGVRDRTMTVDTRGTAITDFDIDDAHRRDLIARGEQTAREFLLKQAGAAP